MRRFRFFTERNNIRVESSVKLVDFEAAHILNSLRLRKDDEIYLFNGEKEFKAYLTMVSKDAVMAKVTEIYRVDEPNPVKIHLYQALTKQKSFELVLDMATELGVSEITPLETDFTVVNIEDKYTKRKDRWEKIILSATKQSERISIPKINNAMKLDDALETFTGTPLLCTTTPNEKIENFSLDSENSDEVAIFIGPEGGFSPRENALFDSKKLKQYSINNNILRSETATIVALAKLQHILGE